MKIFVFNMEILDNVEDEFIIKICNESMSTSISFEPKNKILKFLGKDKLTEYLKENEYQLRKILHNKRKDTFYKGFSINFALRDKKDVAAFNDRSKIVILDKRNGNNDSYVLDNGEKNIFEIYTDGTFMEKINVGAYAVLIKDLEGKYTMNSYKADINNSSLIELLAAIKGVETLVNVEKIRIVTDSQYVRKGLTEWIVNWKLNGWHTANGEKVKYIDYWKKFDKITEGKYIEFQWVKGHSNHFENTLCDIYAREMAKK